MIQTIRSKAIALSVSLLLFAALDAKADSITIFMDHLQDAALESDPTDTVADRVDRTDSNITARSSPTRKHQRLIFEFPISTLSGLTIQSAAFSFAVQGGTVEFIVYPADGVTEATDWIPAGGTSLTLFTPPPSGGKTIETIDVMSALISLLNDGEAFFGIQIKAVEGNQAMASLPPSCARRRG